MMEDGSELWRGEHFLDLPIDGTNYKKSIQIHWIIRRKDTSPVELNSFADVWTHIYYFIRILSLIEIEFPILIIGYNTNVYTIMYVM